MSTTRQEEIQARIKAELARPCKDPADQATRDRLANADKLYAAGHTLACAIGIIWEGKDCECDQKNLFVRGRLNHDPSGSRA